MPFAKAPKEKPSSQVKPARAMTLPLRDPKPSNGAKRKVKQGEPFDPEELTRRLTAHLAEQKVRAKQRRDARAAQEAAAALAAAAASKQNAVYHHVPTVAAAAFERTTSPDVKRQIHKLAQPALRSHLEMLSLDDAPPGAAFGPMSLQRTLAVDQAVVEREAVRSRNQFQWNQDMEAAAEVDLERDVYKPPQRTFPEFAHLKGQKHAQVALRPLSMGDVLSEDDDVQAITKARSKPVYDGRNDWAQEEKIEGERRTVKGLVSPFLRKKESIWILGGKKEKSVKQEEAGIGDCRSPIDGTKSGKASFLARFKRHTS